MLTWRAFFGLLGLLVLLLALMVEVGTWIWPPEREPLVIAAEAFAAGGGQLFAAKARAGHAQIKLKPSPEVKALPPSRPPSSRTKPLPRPPRLKGSLEPFNRWQFDQRTIV